MATQRADLSPKTKRLGIFPDSIRKFVIVFALILFVIAGIIGIQQAWGNLSNILAVIFGVVGVILGILTFWPSNKSNEASAPASPVSPVQVNNYINVGQQTATQNIHSSVMDSANNIKHDDPNPIPNTSGTNSQQPSSNTPGVQAPVTPASTLSQLELPDTLFDATHKDPSMRLSDEECIDLTNDLLAAYPVREDFEIMLKGKLHRNLNILVDDAHNYWNLIFKLIEEVTEAEGWTSDLVIAAYEWRPRNPELQKWRQRYSPRQVSPGMKAHHGMISSLQSDLDVNLTEQTRQTKRQQRSEELYSSTELVQQNHTTTRPKTNNPTENGEKHDIEKRSLEEPLPNTLRGCVVGTQRHVNEAYNLLNPEMNLLPEDIKNAARFLETAKGDIEHLQELLQENSPLPEHGSIIDQVRIIVDQIDEYLIPHLKPSETPDKDFQRRFTPLLKALNKLDTLIPN